MDRIYDILKNVQAAVENQEIESPKTELNEYKQDFLEMNIGSLTAIMQHAKNILDSLGDPSVKENLTESWLQGKIAITEDYMRTIHDFVKYVSDDDDTTTTTAGCGCGGNKKKPNVETTKAEPEQTQQQSQKEEKPQS